MAYYLDHTRIAQKLLDQQGQINDLREENGRLRVDLEAQRKARQTAAGGADRFRDVLSEALGHPDETPGDDVLIATLREHFGKTGPEPTRWRDFLTGAEAIKDQINAAAREG